MPVSKNQIKLISSLFHKKFRDETKLFTAEGTKLVKDMKPFFECSLMVATKQWLDDNELCGYDNINTITHEELKKISNQKNPQGILAVFKKPDYVLDIHNLCSTLSLALDDIQDPGNLGTIVRIADWFGIENILCSENCADVFSPKTVQATMGALARVKVHYVDLEFLLKIIPAEVPIYGTFMNGNNIYSELLTQNGIVVMGNEGKGISPKIEKLVTSRLLIPNFPKDQITTESLNVGVATAIVCAEFRRSSG
ncbi:MAG: RNA methyltransferase [Paludibacter sp.]|nr:RNA methyltransferase [Paludibacter sp.]